MTVFTETLSGLWLFCVGLWLFCVLNKGLDTSLLLCQYYSVGHRFSLSFSVLSDASHVAHISPKSDLGRKSQVRNGFSSKSFPVPRAHTHNPEQEVFWGSLLQIPHCHLSYCVYPIQTWVCTINTWLINILKRNFKSVGTQWKEFDCLNSQFIYLPMLHYCVLHSQSPFMNTETILSQ